LAGEVVDLEEDLGAKLNLTSRAVFMALKSGRT
jgi:hypothetical protein